MKKLISLDIDGTLYTSKENISAETKAALLRAQENGCILILASGRPTAGLIPIADELEMNKHHGMLLSYNGGVVIDYKTDETIYSNVIPNELAKKLLKHLEKFDVNPIVDDGMTIYTTDPNSFQVSYESRSNHLKIKQIANIYDAINFDPAKILIAAPAEILERETEKIIKPFKSELVFVLSEPFYLESTLPGVSKAAALKKVCEALNVPLNDVIAFGNAQNDIPMLELAGCAVAMSNACEELKDIADYVTASNDEDGIAHALKKFGI